MPIVWMSNSRSRAVCERLPGVVLLSSPREFLDAQRDAKTVSFLDSSTLATLDQLAKELGSPVDGVPSADWRKLLAAVSLGPVIAVCDQPLPTAIGWLPPHPWLSHVLSSTMLEHAMASEHLRNVLMTLASSGPTRLLDWLKPTAAGRRIRLTHASRRMERLERMSEFFGAKGVDASTVSVLRNATDELLTNAFYDAPVTAGLESKPIARTHDVSLPDDCACELVYGAHDSVAIVRVRDPFGSLTRERLVEVLTRCARTDVPVERDTSMGGDGMGMWRVFSVAAVVAVSVVKHRHTEVLIGVARQPTVGQPPFAFHFFFKDGARRRLWKLLDDDTGKPADTNSVSVSVTVIPD